jgi:hypothetical protein
VDIPVTASRPRRILGEVERAARRDIRNMPAEFRTCAVAVAYILLARRLDAGMSARDAGSVARELRMALLTLREMAPPQHAGDYVDEVKAAREKRMSSLAMP